MPPWNLPNFTTVELLRRARSDVYRLRRDEDETMVIAKVVPVTGTSGAAERLRCEYDTLCKLRSAANPAIVEPLDLLEVDNRLVMLARDIGGQDLHQWHGPMDVATALHIGARVASALTTVHAARFAHKDINPGNVVFNATTGNVQLIDFDIAAPLELGSAGAESNVVQGTLPYISPEQTGRTAHLVDHRADIYALGALLYTLLSGSPPFPDTDPGALLLAVLTQYPPALTHVPAVVQRIVERLLRKNPAERYVSAHGVQRDLTEVARGLQANEDLLHFELGREDRSATLRLEHRLYGRETQLRALESALDDARSGQLRVAMLHGPSGTGKSALAQALLPRIREHGGLFAAGKFDQLRRHVPLSAFTQAVDQLIRYILSQPADVIDDYRQRVQASLGTIGQALADVAPAIEFLVGKQPPVMALPPFETENRLLTVVQRFLRCLASERPLVLFLDDLQWADSGTLKYLENLARDVTASGQLFIIGAYREQEALENVQLTLFLDNLRALAANAVTRIELSALAAADVRQLVADVLAQQDVDTLCQIVIEKTGGNAFFVGEFLRYIWQCGLLTYTPASGMWSWDLAGIRALAVTDNVVALLTDMLRTLPDRAQSQVCIAACIGHRFALEAIADVSGVSTEQAAHDIFPAVQAGLMIPLGRDGQSQLYQFAHDRVQQACYEQISAADAMRHHYAIGKHLLAQGSGSSLFEALDHLNRCHPLLTDERERASVASLNHRAGREALRATAYGAAREYLQSALTLSASLPETAQDSRRDIELDLADSEYLLGDNTSADTRLRRIVATLPDPIDRALIYRRRVFALWGAGRSEEALRVGIEGLQLLGLRISVNPSPAAVGVMLLRVRYRLRGHTPQTLAALPRATDRRATALLEYAAGLMGLCFLTDHGNLLARLVLEMVRLTLEHGLTPLAPAGLGMAGLIYLMAFRDAKLAKTLTDAAHDLMQKDETLYPALVWAATFQTMHLFVSAAKTPYMVTEACRAGIQSGDLIHTAMIAQGGVTSWMALSLERAAGFADQMRDAVSHRDVLAATNFRFFRQSLRCLRGQTRSPVSFDSDDYNEADHVASMLALPTPFPIAVFWLTKLSTAVIMRHWEMASELVANLSASTAVAFFRCNIGMLQLAYFAAIAMTQTHLATANKRLPRAIGRWRRELAWFAKVGIEASYQGLLDIVDAEIAQCHGQHARAAWLYHRGLAALPQHKLFSILAHECAGRFFARHGDSITADACLRAAQAMYDEWGARPKTEALAHEFAQLSVSGALRGPVTEPSRITTTGSYGADLDFATALKTSQAVAQEVVLPRLIQLLMREIRVSAGADVGLLLLRGDSGFVVRASHDSHDDTPELLNESMLDGGRVPARVVQYVERTQEMLLLRTGDGNPLWDDSYFATHQPQVILCAPLRRQGVVAGCVYLENQLDAAAFNRQRLALIEIIAAQGMIALENAELYASLEVKVEERSRALREAQARLLTLERANTESQMAGGFAHEMRNSLFAADAMLESLVDDGGQWDAQQAREALLATQASVKRGLRITRQVLEYAQLGSLIIDKTPVRLNRVVDRVLSEMRSSLDGLRVEVDSNIGELTATIKEDHLYSIVQNLLANARDAVSELPADAPRRIVLRADREAACVSLRIADSGAGVAPSVRARLFQPFVSTKGAHGTGLGLGMVKKLVEAYDGRIELTSAAGDGAEFSVTLPAPR